MTTQQNMPGTRKFESNMIVGGSKTKKFPRALKTCFIGSAIFVLVYSPYLISPLSHISQSYLMAAEKNYDINELIRGVKSDSLDEQEHAILILKDIGPAAKDAIPAIIEYLFVHGFGGGISWNAKVALINIGQESVPYLIDALNVKFKNDLDITRRRASIAFILGSIGPKAKDAVPSLLEVLKAKDVTLMLDAECRTVIDALIDIGPEATPGLLEYLKKYSKTESEVDPYTFEEVRKELINELDQRHFSEAAQSAVPAFVNLLKNGDLEPKKRCRVINVLNDISHDARVVNALIACLNDKEDESVRVEALETLGYIGPDAKPALPVLNHLLEDKNTKIKEYAAEVIEKIQGKKHDSKK